jgi:hypothetical protein
VIPLCLGAFVVNLKKNHRDTETQRLHKEIQNDPQCQSSAHREFGTCFYLTIRIHDLELCRFQITSFGTCAHAHQSCSRHGNVSRRHDSRHCQRPHSIDDRMPQEASRRRHHRFCVDHRVGLYGWLPPGFADGIYIGTGCEVHSRSAGPHAHFGIDGLHAKPLCWWKEIGVRRQR